MFESKLGSQGIDRNISFLSEGGCLVNFVRSRFTFVETDLPFVLISMHP